MIELRFPVCRRPHISTTVSVAEQSTRGVLVVLRLLEVFGHDAVRGDILRTWVRFLSQQTGRRWSTVFMA